MGSWLLAVVSLYFPFFRDGFSFYITCLFRSQSITLVDINSRHKTRNNDDTSNIFFMKTTTTKKCYGHEFIFHLRDSSQFSLSFSRSFFSYLSLLFSEPFNTTLRSSVFAHLAPLGNPRLSFRAERRGEGREGKVKREGRGK